MATNINGFNAYKLAVIYTTLIYLNILGYGRERGKNTFKTQKTLRC